MLMLVKFPHYFASLSFGVGYVLQVRALALVQAACVLRKFTCALGTVKSKSLGELYQWQKKLLSR